MTYRDGIRVIHLSRYYDRGGAAIAARRIFESQLKLGVDARFLNEQGNFSERAYNPLNFYWRVYRKIVIKLIGLIRLGLDNKIRPYFTPSFFYSPWVRIINSMEADVVNLHWLGSDIIPMWQIVKINKPVIITLHDHQMISGSIHIDGDFRVGYLVKKFCQINKSIQSKNWGSAGVRLIVPSQFLKDAVERDSSLCDLHVTKIPHPFIGYYNSSTEKSICRRLFDIEPSDINILFPANPLVDQNKGFDRLVLAVGKIKHLVGRKIKIIHLGGPVGSTELLHGAECFGFGPIKSACLLKQLYCAVDVVCVPSYYESFGLVGQESISLGVPALVQQRIGLDELKRVENGHLVLSVDFGDSAQVASRLKEAVELPSRGVTVEQSKSMLEYEKRAQHYIEYYRAATLCIG